MSVTTYVGVVRKGRVHVDQPVDLPDGSPVYIVAPRTIDVRIAQRTANRWLVERVGYMLMADEPTLVQTDGRTVWRFVVYITGSSHPPLGPIGHLDVDAVTGEILASPDLIEEMKTRGARLAGSLASSTR